MFQSTAGDISQLSAHLQHTVLFTNCIHWHLESNDGIWWGMKHSRSVNIIAQPRLAYSRAQEVEKTIQKSCHMLLLVTLHHKGTLLGGTVTPIDKVA